MFKIRPFEATDAEYTRVVEIHNACWPDDPNTVENMKHSDKMRNPKYLHQRWMIELADTSGKVIGECWAAESAWSYEAGKYNVGFRVDPEFAHLEFSPDGVADTYMAFLMDFLNQREPAPKKLTDYVREDKSDRIQYYEAQGFKSVMREQESELDLTAFDPTPFQGATEKAKSHGIIVYGLAELKEMHEDWQNRLYDLEMKVLADVPSPSEFTPQPIEEWAKVFTYPDFLEEGWYIAVDHEDGDKYVGITNIWNNKPNPEKLYTGLTGTRRESRRKGIATALKLRALAFAKERGAKRLVTENEENNPMYQINVRLGFKAIPAWLAFQKEIKG